MNYYEIWVRSSKYKGTSGLTYASPKQLSPGSIVRVELQNDLVSGIVVKRTSRPAIRSIKPISEVLDLPSLPAPLLKTAEWLKAYYPSSVGAVAQLLLPPTIPKHITPLDYAPTPELTPQQLSKLTPEQQTAVNAMTTPNTYLLHGRTGSGKTRVYLELAHRSLEQGASVLILSPEISLTSQLAQSFQRLAGNRVIILHSQLTAAQRFAAWRTIAEATKPLIIIGPRSALFSPVTHLGLIVVDESHEPAYKQEQAPRYHASRVAAILAKVHDATLILGSATPLTTDYYLAEKKQKNIIRLSNLARTTDFKTKTVVVDLKDREQFTKSNYLSNALITSILTSLRQGEQSLLYLNRRGTARLALCQNCGWQALCPHCDLPLTFHGDQYLLRCHVCTFSQQVPTTCPVCGHTEVVFKSIGTKAIVSEVNRLFPEAKVMRFDSDNTKAERFEQQYDQIISGNVDILIGTQTLAKGLDLPLLSTLGVILADTSLYMPDYTAQERTYQLVNQVLGRVQRGHRNANAIIQTYNAESITLQAALTDDWPAFYNTELAERQTFGYPPFTFVAKLSCRRASPAAAEKAANILKEKLLVSYPDLRIDGPAPALHEKFQNKYEWQLIIKATKRAILVDAIKSIPATWSADIDPVNLL